MQRRALLAVIGAGTLGVAGVAGCLNAEDSDVDAGTESTPGTEGSDGESDDDGGSDGESTSESSEWVHGIAGSVSTVVDGRVVGHELFADEDADGGVFALDAETGDHEWTYGETDGYHTFTDLAVDDAIYVGYGDDAVGSGSGETIAVEFDGEQRWAQNTGSVYSRPRLDDEALYVGDDAGAVSAFDRESGSERWSTDNLRDSTPESVDVEAVEDVVYATTDRLLLGLDREDGSVRWKYEEPNSRMRYPAVADGVAYVSTAEGVAAVVDGEEQWTATFETGAGVGAVADDRVVVSHGNGVDVLDADGNERWTRDDVGRRIVTVHDGVLYAGEERLHAFDLSDGRGRWHVDAEPGFEFESLRFADDGTVFAQGGRRIARLDSTGDVRWHETFADRIRGYVVDDVVFVGTDAAVHAVVPE